MAMARRVDHLVKVFVAAPLAFMLATQAVSAIETPSLSSLSPLMMTSERVANHSASGFAVDGYDVVSYFVDGKVLPGTAEFETIWSGTTWRFSSRANQVAFERDPMIYAPRFGGYDAQAAARGALSEADPTIFKIVKGRLYLFRTTSGRDQLQDQATALIDAEVGWKNVERQLVWR
jgi:YHS domain-containing protein